MLKQNYKLTMSSCFVGYIVQAITVNFPPLLFVAFMNEFGIDLAKISFLITFTFVIQLCIDIILAGILSSKNVRILAVCAQISAIIGLVCLAVLPNFMENKFLALMISAFFYSGGSGLIEVVASPIVESCPNDNKSAAMSLLHSFYCWGSALTIGISTAFFAVFGIENWRILAIVWAIIPAIDAFAMAIMPIGEIESEKGRQSKPLKNKSFILMLILMFVGGAAELAISQWASAFAETGLHISKSAGDLAGPFLFAIMMGTGRVLFTILGNKIRLINYMLMSSILCITGFALAAFSSNPILALIGTALSGFAVAIMWPGTLSLASSRIGASAAAFGMLACFGDIGCTTGPAVVGFISQKFGGSISVGLRFGMMFPVIMLIMVIVLKYKRVKTD